MGDLYERVIREELAYWPGVAVEFGRRSKHRAATFHFAGSTRFVVYPDSPSDARRGHLNSLADVRKELAALGAERLERRPWLRKRGPRVISHRMPNRPDWASRIERAPVKPNPFDVLAHIAPVAQSVERPTFNREIVGSSPRWRTIWQRFRNWLPNLSHNGG